MDFISGVFCCSTRIVLLALAFARIIAAMKNKFILAGFSLLCLACLAGITIILYDVVFTATGDDVSGYGAAAVFIMAVALVIRYLWQNRQTGC